MFIQQHGGPPDWILIVRAHIKQLFPDRSFGRAGLISWPAISPDITACDFSRWKYMKDSVYQTSVADNKYVKDRIEAA
jgi:hypothetical protein